MFRSSREQRSIPRQAPLDRLGRSNPWADPQGNGFQTIQSLLSIHSGHLFGTGLGNGNSKLFFLPEVHTDFIFALIGEELGFVGAGLLLALFIYFAYLRWRLNRRRSGSDKNP